MPSTQPVQTLVIKRPDDWHVHLRDGEILTEVLPHTAKQFGRAVVMPNLKPPITTVDQALAYQARIIQALPQGVPFEPLMTLYLTEHTTPQTILEAKQSGVIHAVKYYPAGATTHSDAGVKDWRRCAAVFDIMQTCGMPLLIHGEVVDGSVDVFDREAVFIETILHPLREAFPLLKVVLEHITTKDAVDYVQDSAGAIGATITAHHLLYNRNAMFQGGIRPHYYCLPILKREIHRKALLAAAISGNPRFFLGTDSAPHLKTLKETSCGCAGCYTAWHAMPLYASVFDAAGALDKLENFASVFGPLFYNLPVNNGTLTLQRTPSMIPNELPIGTETIIPLSAGEVLHWSIAP